MYIVQLKQHDIWQIAKETDSMEEALSWFRSIQADIDNHPDNGLTEARLDYDPHYVPL